MQQTPKSGNAAAKRRYKGMEKAWNIQGEPLALMLTNVPKRCPLRIKYDKLKLELRGGDVHDALEA